MAEVKGGKELFDLFAGNRIARGESIDRRRRGAGDKNTGCRKETKEEKKRDAATPARDRRHRQGKGKRHTTSATSRKNKDQRGLEVGHEGPLPSKKVLTCNLGKGKSRREAKIPCRRKGGENALRLRRAGGIAGRASRSICEGVRPRP